MAPLRMTFNDLEGHICCLKLCIHPPRWFASMMVRWRSNMRGCQQRWW